MMMFSAKNVKRSAGKSIVGAVAYRTGTSLEDVTGNVFDYTPRSKSKSVFHTEIFAPKDCPEWAADRGMLWNKADVAEKRRDAVTGRELILNLPHELSDQGRLDLLARFSREIVARHGCVVDAAVHRPDRKGDPRNHHAHCMLSTRRLTASGFGEKTRELDEKKNPALEKLRETWAQYTNEALAKAGHDVRIDHRSYERQGIDRKPGIHVGTYASELERQGVRTGRGNYNRKISVLNTLKAATTWTFSGWTRQQEIATQAADLRAEVARQEQAAAQRKAEAQEAAKNAISEPTTPSPYDSITQDRKAALEAMRRSGGMIQKPPPKPVEPPKPPRSHDQIGRLIALAASERDEPPIWMYCHGYTKVVLRQAQWHSKVGAMDTPEFKAMVREWEEAAQNKPEWAAVLYKDIKRLDHSYEPPEPQTAAERKETAQARDDYEPPNPSW
jgi:hypothetical protein